jgi:predicted enzyme related to lactoylglutathione lyase
MAGEPSFFEIGVPDAKRARSFYSRVFDWAFHSWPDSDMSWIETPGARGGIHEGDPEHRIEIYFAVPDIEAAIARVRQAGGQADDPRPEAEGFGRFTACRDDQGVRFGLHQPAAH